MVEKVYKYVAPDGGWGYFIWIAIIINVSTPTMFLPSFGMIFNDFMKEIDMDTTGMNLLNGIAAVFSAVGGFAAGALTDKLSLRQLTFLSSVLFNIGLLGCVFSYSKLTFFIFFGIFPSIGSGMMYAATCTSLNHYFVKKRLLSISVTQSMSAALAMTAPLFIQWSLSEYGYRGTLLLITGIGLQTFVATSLMQPVSMHLKKVETQTVEEEELIATKLLDVDTNNPIIKLTEEVLPKEYVDVEKTSDFDEPKKKVTFTMWIKSSLDDVGKLKSFMLSNASIGTATAMFAELNISAMYPLALYAEGWSNKEVALAIALQSLGDLVTRLLLAVFSGILQKVGSHEIYVCGLLGALFTRLGFLWSSNHTTTLVFITLMGIPRCAITVLPPLVIADSVPDENFPAAMGYFMVLFGAVSLAFGTAIGYVRDLTDSYATAFYINATLYAITALFWIIELCYKKNKHKRVAAAANTKRPQTKNRRK